jgi:hypothetical protein
MRRSINSLSYCYFLLGHPTATLGQWPHRHEGAPRRRPALR